MSVVWFPSCGHEVMTVLRVGFQKETKKPWFRKLNTDLKWPDCDIAV